MGDAFDDAAARLAPTPIQGFNPGDLAQQAAAQAARQLRQPNGQPLNPYVDQFAVPRVTVNVGGKLVGGVVQGGFEVVDVLDYCYTSDIITLTDTATIDIANPDGKYSRTGATNTIPRDSRIVVSMADPNVSGGANIPRLTGLVVNPRMTSRGGEKIQLQCADQGWYLERCDAPLFFNMQASKNLEDLTSRLMQGPKKEDYGWGYQNADGSLNVLWNNVAYQDILRKLNQGAAGAERSVRAQALKAQSIKVSADTYVDGSTLPPLQAGEGTKVGQILVDFARRGKMLVNATSDGSLMFFRPNYSQSVSYRIEYHADDRRSRNNALDITIDDSADGIPTDVWCVAHNPWLVAGSAPTDFNAAKMRARYTNIGAAQHYMRTTFGDSDQISQTLVQKRAEWFLQRALFDGFTMTVEVFGHSQGGVFFAPDTMVAVNDSVHNVVGNYYCSACRYQRDAQGGTRTVLTLRKPNLLAA